LDAGREDQTPPETLRIGDPWQVRVVPNLYPAFERQEVVIHTPEHVRSFADLSDAQVALVAEAWQQRIETALDEGFEYVHALINEGRLAGASLPHILAARLDARAPPGRVRRGQCAAGQLLEQDSPRPRGGGAPSCTVGAAPTSLIAGGTLADRSARPRLVPGYATSKARSPGTPGSTQGSRSTCISCRA
jgi:hypothetical protein